MTTGIYVRSKNEKNIINFMKHYYNIGFDFILFYDDMSYPSIQDVINSENNKEYDGKYKIIRNEDLIDNNIKNLNNNEYFMDNILPVIKENMDFCFYIDMDEYLKINSNKNIKDIIEQFDDFDSIKINWLLFGNNGIKKCEDLSNPKKIFTKSFNKLYNHIKSLTRVSKICGCNNPHYFMLKENSIVKNIFGDVSLNDHVEDKLTNYKFNDVPFYLAHFIVQGTYGFITRRFCRNTANYKIFKHKNLKLFIETNMDNIINFIHFETVKVKNISKHEMEIVTSLKGFLNFHNGNEMFNQV